MRVNREKILRISWVGAAVVLTVYFINVFVRSLVWQVERYDGITVVFAALILLALLRARRWLSRVKTGPCLATAAVIYAIWLIVSQSVPFSDFNTFFEHARGFGRSPSASILSASKSPTTVLYYSFFTWIGSSLLAAQVGSILAWITASFLLYRALINLEVSAVDARLAAALFLFFPSVVIYSVVISSEAVFVLLAAAAVCLSTSVRQSKHPLLILIFLGTLLGLLILTRSNGAVFAVGLLVYVMFKNDGWKIAIRNGAIVLGCLVAVLLAHGAMQWKTDGRFNVSPSSMAGYNFLAGTNINSNGRYNIEDLKLAGFIGKNSVPHEQANERAVEIALERIAENPLGFARFAFSEKIVQLWNSDARDALSWAVGQSPARDSLERYKVRSRLQKTGDAVYLIVLALFPCFLFAALATGRASLELLSFLALPLLGLAFLHVFIEVQARYHVPFMMLMVPCTGLMLMRLERRPISAMLRRWRSADDGERRAPGQDATRSR